jgi:hypothetical protein
VRGGRRAGPCLFSELWITGGIMHRLETGLDNPVIGR